MSKGFSTPGRAIVTVTEVFTGPRIRSIASCSFMPMTCAPSMAVMKSPLLMPARSAGVPSMGATTFTRPFSIVTSMPRPENSPRVCTCMSRKSFGFM